MVKWNIGTFARIRPPRRNHDCAKFVLEKLDDGTQSAARISFPPPSEGDDAGFSLKQRELLQFQFSDIFDPGVSQDEIFRRACLDIVQSALDGYNGTILAYGQTGSGKTYTITGGEHYADRGIIPRVLSTIFEEFERRSASVRYSCFVSYLEIYNETVYDLLDRSHTDRPIEEWTKVLLMDDDEGEMHFRNLGVYEAVSEEEALNLLFLGNMNRVTSDTPMNQASSRSHSVFSVMIEARPVDSEVIVTSKLHLVDLAGSERVYKREGTQRMRSEGKHINLSLHHLEQVILSLRASKRSTNTLSKTYHVPYRNSMLTSVLRGSLGGNCKSVFIATLNPESEFGDESISTCRFMQRCSEVSVDVVVNSEVDTEKRLAALEKSNAELETSNCELKAWLEQVESELKSAQAQRDKYQRDTLLWLHERAEMQAEMAQLTAEKNQRREDEPLDWGVCEDLVEKLLLTGDVPRHVLEKKQDNEEEEEEEEDDETREARQLFLEVTDEIQRRGLLCAVGCLAVMRESTAFASNTAVELQELMDKQKQTVELMERHLLDQKQDAEQLKAQIKQLQESKPNGEALAPVPRSKSHSDAQRSTTSSHSSNRSGAGKSAGGGVNGAASYDGSDGSESDSDLDSEAPDSRHYPHPQQQQATQSGTTVSLVFNSGSRTLSAANTNPRLAPVAPMPPMTKSLPPNPERDTEDGRAGGVAKPAAQAVKSGSDVIRRRMELLKTGSLFVKYGRYGKPHVRFVWCSTDLEYLHYRKASAHIAKASIPTRTMQKVTLGQSTKVFERAKQPSREPFCFSIEYDDGSARTLDLEITDGESVELKKLKRADWVEALQFLIKLKAAQQQKKATPTAGVPASNTPS